MVQTLGYHLQHIVELGFFCDAWAQLRDGEGRAIDGKGASATWMNGWTIFYWGWWIAWAPFVGMFIAKISVGRTVKEFIAGTMAAPVIYVFMWMIIFGGSGLRMER